MQSKSNKLARSLPSWRLLRRSVANIRTVPKFNAEHLPTRIGLWMVWLLGQVCLFLVIPDNQLSSVSFGVSLALAAVCAHRKDDNYWLLPVVAISIVLNFRVVASAEMPWPCNQVPMTSWKQIEWLSFQASVPSQLLMGSLCAIVIAQFTVWARRIIRRNCKMAVRELLSLMTAFAIIMLVGPDPSWFFRWTLNELSFYFQQDGLPLFLLWLVALAVSSIVGLQTHFVCVAYWTLLLAGVLVICNGMLSLPWRIDLMICGTAVQMGVLALIGGPFVLIQSSGRMPSPVANLDP